MIGRIPQEVSAEIIKTRHFMGHYQSSSTPSLHQCIKECFLPPFPLWVTKSSNLIHWKSLHASNLAPTNTQQPIIPFPFILIIDAVRTAWQKARIFGIYHLFWHLAINVWLMHSHPSRSLQIKRVNINGRSFYNCVGKIIYYNWINLIPTMQWSNKKVLMMSWWKINYVS